MAPLLHCLDIRRGILKPSFTKGGHQWSTMTLKFTQIAVTADGLNGLTGHGDVWRFDPSACLWKPLPMVSEESITASRRAASG